MVRGGRARDDRRTSHRDSYRGGRSYHNSREGYNSKYSHKGTIHGIYRASSYSVNPRVPKLDQIGNSHTRWDEHAAGFENISAQQVKLLGTCDLKLSDELLKQLQVSPLTPENSTFNRSLVVNGDWKSYVEHLLQQFGLDPVEKSFELKNGSSFVVFAHPKDAALLLALPGDLTVERPPGLVTSQSEDIFSNETTTIDLAGDIEVTSVDRSMEVRFSSQNNGGRPLYDKILHENPDLVDCKVEDIANLANATSIRSSAMVILNAVSEQEFKNKRELEEIEQELKLELQNYGKLESLEVVAAANRLVNVYCKYADADSCATAIDNVGGRIFSGRTLIAAPWDAEALDLGIFI